jgi:hypothetical protein
MSSDPKGLNSSFKTLDLVADESWLQIHLFLFSFSHVCPGSNTESIIYGRF